MAFIEEEIAWTSISCARVKTSQSLDRDIIEILALIEVSLHYSSVKEIWDEPQITSICSSAYPLTLICCAPGRWKYFSCTSGHGFVN
jgi:hypothetical protein